MVSKVVSAQKTVPVYVDNMVPDDAAKTVWTTVCHVRPFVWVSHRRGRARPYQVQYAGKPFGLCDYGSFTSLESALRRAHEVAQ